MAESNKLDFKKEIIIWKEDIHLERCTLSTSKLPGFLIFKNLIRGVFRIGELDYASLYAFLLQNS